MKSKILWIDGIGGLSVGILVLIFHSCLSELYNLPLQIVIFLGIMNVLYGSYSTPLAMREKRKMGFIIFLSIANMTWCFVCLALFLNFRETISIFGLLQLLGEGLYVGALGLVEWRWRNDLLRS